MFLRPNSYQPASGPRRSARLLVALTMGAGLVAAAPGAAQARTVTDTDDVKDMAKLVDPATGDFEAAPRQRLNDVTSTKLIHTSDKVGAELTVARLSKTDVLRWGLEITSSKGEVRQATLLADEGGWSGELSVVDSESGEGVECGRHDIDYADDVVRITLPKDCIGGGRWMRFRAFAMRLVEDVPFIDDALLDRPLKDGTNEPVLSRRVYR